MPIGIELCYPQGLPDESRLTSSPSWVDAPTRKMLIAALRSRSCTVPQSLHCQVLSRRFNASLTAPQTEQVLLVGYHLSMNLILTPFFLAIYTNFLTKSAKPKSLTLRPHRAFIPCRFKSSSRISSYSSVSWCASFQWKSSRWFAILRCFSRFSGSRSYRDDAKSNRARSLLRLCFFFRQCLPLARLTALILRLKNCGDSISCPL